MGPDYQEQPVGPGNREGTPGLPAAVATAAVKLSVGPDPALAGGLLPAAPSAAGAWIRTPLWIHQTRSDQRSCPGRDSKQGAVLL